MVAILGGDPESRLKIVRVLSNYIFFSTLRFAVLKSPVATRPCTGRDVCRVTINN